MRKVEIKIVMEYSKTKDKIRTHENHVERIKQFETKRIIFFNFEVNYIFKII